MSELVVKDRGDIVNSLDDVERVAKTLAASGYFADARQAAQAVAKILAGRELGISPFAAMSGVQIINGKPALSAQLVAGLIKRSGRYRYDVAEISDTRCELMFYERDGQGWRKLGPSMFTADDARRGGVKNMERYPRNMLFARALTNGARWYCPDVFVGGVYTPDELGGEMAEDDTVPIQDVTPAQDVTPEQYEASAEDEEWLLASYCRAGENEQQERALAAAFETVTPKGKPLGGMTPAEIRDSIVWFESNPARQANAPELYAALKTIEAALATD